MSDITFLIEADHDGGYVATAVGESIVTQGETLEEVRAMIRDAVHCHFTLMRVKCLRDPPS